jgi:hypothetical protein
MPGDLDLLVDRAGDAVRVAAFVLLLAAPAAAQEAAPAPPPSSGAASPAADAASAGAESADASTRARPSDPLRAVGQPRSFTRPLAYDLTGVGRAEVAVDLDARIERASRFTLDAAGTQSSGSATVSPRARLALTLRSDASWPVAVMAAYEQDLPTGTSTRDLPAGIGMPGDTPYATPLRKAYVRLAYRDAVVAGAGVMTSHFGLGLLANDGAHGWEPGSARFADPRGGDRVLRAFLGTGPLGRAGLVALVAVDEVLEDDALLGASQPAPSTGGDSAKQAVGLVSMGRPGADWAGVYAAYRDQTTSDGRWLHATAFDLSATLRRPVAPSADLFVGTEAAYVVGDTSFAPTPTFTTQQLRQFGAAVRSTLDLGTCGVALDGLYASGDGNPDDSYQTGFRASSNYDFGLILFRQVMAAQSARSPITAANPALVGTAATGLERVPTRGSATDTVAVFPRLFVRPIQGLEVYGGALFAWAPAGLIDPFNSAVAGGTARNALNGSPGSYLGTELDAGVRGRFLFWGTELALGVEGGVLISGSAFQSATGSLPAAVSAGRVMVGYRL